ncbi:hypothetical protein K492DRAFT_37932 [Lichtheimia hyalospora FSU 10163]|nr:hypothetical protein K492DRAFT_37932 [Lichtheimia hyalospora FSU 10163]
MIRSHNTSMTALGTLYNRDMSVVTCKPIKQVYGVRDMDIAAQCSLWIIFLVVLEVFLRAVRLLQLVVLRVVSCAVHLLQQALDQHKPKVGKSSARRAYYVTWIRLINMSRGYHRQWFMLHYQGRFTTMDDIQYPIKILSNYRLQHIS